MSRLIFWLVIQAYICVVLILVCPRIRLTVSMGTPCDSKIVVAVEEGLQVVGGKVLHIGIRQSRENRKNKEIEHQFISFVLHRSLYQRLYFLFRDNPSPRFRGC